MTAPITNKTAADVSARCLESRRWRERERGSDEAFGRKGHPKRREVSETGAGDGNRTHVRGLGSRYSTIEPRPLWFVG